MSDRISTFCILSSHLTCLETQFNVLQVMRKMDYILYVNHCVLFVMFIIQVGRAYDR